MELGSQSHRDPRSQQSRWSSSRPLQRGPCHLTPIEVGPSPPVEVGSCSANVQQVGQGLFAATPSLHNDKPRFPSRRQATSSGSADQRPVENIRSPLSKLTPPERRMQKLDRIAEKASALQNFFWSDVDLSGTLDFSEFRKLEMKRSNGTCTEAELRDRFQALDVNGDGRIDIQEYIQSARRLSMSGQ